MDDIEQKPPMVPAEVVAAISAARPELLRMGTPRAMDEEEVRGMYAAIAMLIQECFSAQQKAKQLETQLRRVHGLIGEVNAAVNTAGSGVRLALVAATRATDEEDE